MIDEKKIAFFEVKEGEGDFPRSCFPQARTFPEPIQSTELSEDDREGIEILSVMVHSLLNRKTLEQFPNLRFIVTRSVGYDHIDLAYCHERGIPVAHVPDYGSHVIAEHVFALLLSSARHVLEGELETQQGIFDDRGLMGIALKGKTMGVIGTGKIGSHVCRIASKGFLMNVLAYDVHPNPELAERYNFQYVDTLDELYTQSDIITLHVPLFDSTRYMVNRETIAKMKDGVILINTSRGGLIKTEDLVEAIRAGKFLHVALDVVEHEENIREVKELLELPGVIITPHIAYYTRESVENMYNSACDSIWQFLRGEEVVNRVQGF